MYAGVAHKGTPPSSHCNNRRSMKMIFPHSSGAQTPNFYTRIIKTLDKVRLLALAPVSVALDPTLTQKTDILQLCRYVLQIEIDGYRSLCFRYLDPGSGSSICDPRTFSGLDPTCLLHCKYVLRFRCVYRSLVLAYRNE